MELLHYIVASIYILVSLKFLLENRLYCGIVFFKKGSNNLKMSSKNRYSNENSYVP